MRRIPALIGAVVLVTGALVGCTAFPGAGACDPEFSAGDASKLVTATGDVGSKPTVDFPTPLISDGTQVTTLVSGTGAQVVDGSVVDFDSVTYLGTTAENIAGTEFDGTTFTHSIAGVDESELSQALVCAREGDRLVITTAAINLYPADTLAQNQVDEDATFVSVIDVHAVYLGKANGFNQLPLDGMPNVVTAVDGTPAISVLLQTPPATSRTSVIKAGGGATLAEDDVAVLHYSLWTWPDVEAEKPTSVVSTWETGQPRSITVSDAPELGLPPGLYKALLGAKVGSQLLVVLAPDDDGFTAETAPDAGPDATYIFVVDVLGIQK